MLTPRRIEIFKAVVDEFIKTAEPVGSKTLQKKYNLQYSSATIRNDLLALEEMGYLEKTHTSSGRIPSTAGYRFYCENLLNESCVVDQKMELAIRDAFEASTMNIEEAVQMSCQIMSEMTNMTTGAIGPDSSVQTLQHIKIFPLDQKNLVCVFITNTGHTETKNFHFDEDIPITDIESCTDVLNEKLKNIPIARLAARMEEIRPDLDAVVQRHDLLFTAFFKAFVRFASENVYFSGKDRLLYQPEFEDISKLKKLMSMLDSSTVWKQIGSNENAVEISTRSGAQLTWVNDLAVVRHKFKVSDQESGEFVVVGPSRMDYEKIVTAVEYVSKMIENMYHAKGDDSDHE